MKVKRLFKAFGFAATILAASTQVQGKTFLNMYSPNVSHSHGQLPVAFSQVVQRYLPVDIQVSTGQAAPVGMLGGAKHEYDVFFVAPALIEWMKTREAMFAKVEEAPELAKNIRNILTFPGGDWHFVTYEDSGIRSFNDIKGKKVFLGPPAGGATAVAKAVVQAVTGYEAGKDYELSRYDWNTADTAFVDRQLDLFVVPAAYPSPSVQQYAMVSPIRLLSVPEEAYEDERVKAVLEIPGRTRSEIPAGVYDNQVNKASVDTVGTTVGISVHKDLDEQLVYDMTKAFWEHLDEVHATAEWMKSINLGNALNQMSGPLHVGAYRYYKEVGVNIPEELVPPEVK